jgi:hypothetical protein
VCAPPDCQTRVAFRLETGAIPAPAEGQILLKTTYLSLDPYMRGRMNDAESYAPPVDIGGVLDGQVVAIATPSIPWRRVGTGPDRLANACCGRAGPGKAGRDRHQPADDGIGRPRNARFHGLFRDEGYRTAHSQQIRFAKARERAKAS